MSLVCPALQSFEHVYELSCRAWWISNRAKPEAQVIDGATQLNTTSPFHEADIPPISPNSTLLTTILLHPTVRNISSDILKGQMIASVIILGFVAVFLLREWISQNARPGVFDDAELPPEDEVGVPGEAPPPLALPNGAPPADQIEEQPRPVDVAPVPAPPRLPDIHRPLPRLARIPPINPNQAPVPEEDDENPRFDDRRKVRRRLESPERRRPPPRPRSSPRRMPQPADRKIMLKKQPLALKPEQQEFTFDFTIREEEEPEEQSPLDNEEDRPLLPEDFNNYAMQDPSTSQHPARRPPMPELSLPYGFPSSSSGPLPGFPPLPSPSVAMYSAPEEIEAGPSRPRGYFDLEDIEEDTQRDFDRYFASERFNSELPLDPPPSTDFEVPEVLQDHDGIESANTSQEVNPPWSDDEFEEEEDHEDHEDAIVPFPAPLVNGDGILGLDNEERDAARDNRPNEQEPGRDANRAPGLEDAMDDDMDANIEDDMDGALEAIGLRGPIYGVLQNAAFMTFVLDATIGILVWLPFTIGKTVALLSLDPARMVEVIHSPIRAIRFITDPIVDLVSWLLTRLVFLPLANLLQVTVSAITGTADPIDIVGDASPSLVRVLNTFSQ